MQSANMLRTSCANIVLLSLIPTSLALLPPGYWDGTLPNIVPGDNQASSISPNFKSGLSNRLALFDRVHEKPIPLQLEGMFKNAGIEQVDTDIPNPTEVEKQFLREGPKLVDNLILLRSKLMEDPSMIASTEGARMLEDFQRRYENLKDLQHQFSAQTQPIVQDVLFQMNKFLDPLQRAAGGFHMHLISQAVKKCVGPMLAATAQNVQVLCGIAAAAEVLHVTNKIRATCWRGEGQSTVRRAMLHMHRAESDVVSAGTILDRILSDSMAERELDGNDINHFNIEQHDLAVQLANVRSQIESVRSNTRTDITRHWNWSMRWGVASAVLSVAKQFLHEQAQAQAQGLALGASVSAAVVNLIMTLLRKNTLGELEELQHRHDEALSEHAGLHAQFSEVVKSCREAMSSGGQRVAVREGKLGQREAVGEATANAQEEGGGAAGKSRREAEAMAGALRDLIDGLRRSGGDAAQAEGTVRALVPLLDRLAEAEAGNATLEDAQAAMAQAAALVRGRVSTERGARPGQGRPGDRPSGLRRPSAVPGQERASATPHPADTHPPRTPRPSRLRPRSVAAASATPPPVDPLPTHPRPSRLRPPSVDAGSATPPPVDPPPSHPRPSRLRAPSMALSVTPDPLPEEGTPRPPPQSQLRRPSAGPATPPPPQYERFTPGARATPRKTPGAQLRATRRVAAGERTPGGGGGGGGTERRLEEQLLQLVLMRMEVTDDGEKREHLRTLAGQLREATRAARQQVKASARTEAVLRDCVDPSLAQRIMQAQQEATAKTQEAMRECLQETMRALEDEYKEKEGEAALGGAGEGEAGRPAGGEGEEVTSRAWRQFVARNEARQSRSAEPDGEQRYKRDMASEAPGSSVTPEDVGCA